MLGEEQQEVKRKKEDAAATAGSERKRQEGRARWALVRRGGEVELVTLVEWWMDGTARLGWMDGAADGARG